MRWLWLRCVGVAMPVVVVVVVVAMMIMPMIVRLLVMPTAHPPQSPCA